jgi:hypothetical protein
LEAVVAVRGREVPRGFRFFAAQAQALGAGPTALVNVVTALPEKGAKFVPDVSVSGGNTAALDGLAAAAMRVLSRNLSPCCLKPVKRPGKALAQ